MRKQLYGLAALVAVALMLAIPAVALAQQTQTMGATEQSKTLTGQLSKTDDGNYVLTEQASGDSVRLQGSEQELAKHVDSTVTVTGTWKTDDDGDYFQVQSVRAASEKPMK